MDMSSVGLKDGRVVRIRKFQMEDKEKFIEMYESLSDEAVRWGLPPYNRERLERGWLSNLQGIIAIIVFYKGKIVGMRRLSFLILEERAQEIWSFIFTKISIMWD